MDDRTTINLDTGRLGTLIAGHVLFVLGLVGVVLPVWPTTVFWIAAAACFARSSPRMYRRILNWPCVGPAVGDFLSEGAISRKGKALALSGMAFGLVLVVVAVDAGWPMVAAVAVIGLAGAYVLSRPVPTRAGRAARADVTHRHKLTRTIGSSLGSA